MVLVLLYQLMKRPWKGVCIIHQCTIYTTKYGISFTNNKHLFHNTFITFHNKTFGNMCTQLMCLYIYIYMNFENKILNYSLFVWMVGGAYAFPQNKRKYLYTREKLYYFFIWTWKINDFSSKFTKKSCWKLVSGYFFYNIWQQIFRDADN